MSLDERMRTRLRHLSNAEAAPEEQASVEAIVRGVQRAHRRERARIVMISAAVAAAAAAVLPVVVWPSAPEVVAPPAAAISTQATPRVAHSEESAPTHATPACERALPSWTARDDDAIEALLPNEVRWLRSRDAHAELHWDDGCDHALELYDGRVAVHAMDLRGHALSVRTSLGEVRVVGTAFEVTWDASRQHLSVLVLEGTVKVTLENAQPRFVRAGERFHASRDSAPEAEPATRAELRALGERLAISTEAGPPQGRRPKVVAPDEPTAPTPPDPEPTERIWRPGAPNVKPPDYQPGGDSVQPDGRPMRKPRVIR